MVKKNLIILTERTSPFRNYRISTDYRNPSITTGASTITIKTNHSLNSFTNDPKKKSITSITQISPSHNCYNPLMPTINPANI